MMTQREKLIELIREAQKGNMLVQWGDIANHLLANGVVIPVRCEECVMHGNCIPEEAMMICKIKDGYCAAGKRKEK